MFLCRGMDTRVYAYFPRHLVEQTRRGSIIPQPPHRDGMQSSVPLHKFALFFLQILPRLYDFPCRRCHTLDYAWGTRDSRPLGECWGRATPRYASWSALLGHPAQSTMVCPRHRGQCMPLQEACLPVREELKYGDTSSADLSVPGHTEHRSWVSRRAHFAWNLFLWGRDR